VLRARQRSNWRLQGMLGRCPLSASGKVARRIQDLLCLGATAASVRRRSQAPPVRTLPPKTIRQVNTEQEGNRGERKR
jgi:hypothetical protein